MRTDFLVPLDPNDSLSLQDQVRRGVVRAVVSGDLARGSRAPSSRSLAARLGVSRNTVLLAYQQLVAEGFLIGRERSGLFVAPDMSPRGRGVGEVAGVRGEAKATPWRVRFKTGDPPTATQRTPPDWARYPYPFIDGLIDPSLFPTAEWREASRLGLSPRDVSAWASGQGDADDPMLIEEIRTKILPRRGIFAGPDEVLITLGRQQAISLALDLFADRRSLVVVEEPGYADVREMARRLDARLQHQPVDAHGMIIDDRLAGAEVIVVTPNHHYPTGVTLAPERREALLLRAAEHEAIIVEDDFECETAYFEPSLPALRAMTGGERVVYASSLSSVLEPALRLGFMVADARVIAEARRLRRLSIKHPPLASQRAAAYFLSQGSYDKTMARTGRMLRQRRHALAEALNHYLQRWVSIDPAAGGTSYWVHGPVGVDARSLALEAEQRGVLIEPADVHFQGPSPNNLFRLGVTGVPLERIRAGIEVLAGLIRERISPSFDPTALAPTLRSDEALRAAMAGATLLCKTVYGEPCTIELRPDGSMIGRAGYGNEDQDQGHWWVEGDTWFRQWDSWAYGETSCYRPLIEHGRVQWLNAQGVAVDSAVYVPPGADPSELGDLAP
ncbi:aminotransferase-like domain-containing protein [Phenylobacterium montanum]|uniref:PLP-dependent aminotransferase family protein n=1 Tax=Phenylobacterium montanum TaxID=2823693 RepID=A0A975ISP4_9CAUL|nr:PLP-dependent aminotransferase family protein [Caulobacter sp. S6]QUD85953.1 PLP-dependent aminotransferase family protein [Caulobacter sp. S6]